MLAMHDGVYALATISDDGSSVYVDGQLVVDNGGHRVWPRGATGPVTLTRGVHAIHVRYAQDGGEGAPFHFELLWARAGQPLERIPAWALTPRRVSFWAFALSAALKQALAAAEWLWVGAVVVVGADVGVVVDPEREGVARARAGVAGVRWILAGSLVLNAIGVWWGLPGGSWAAGRTVAAAGARRRRAMVRPWLVRSLSAVSLLRADRGVQPAAAARALGPPRSHVARHRTPA